MNYNQIPILLLQGTIVAFIILLLFRLRKKLGLGVLYACLGLFQFVQVLVFILNTVFDSEISKFLVSPGSSVFITITLFSLLIIYIKEDASETKKMIFAILIVNVLMSILLLAFGWNIKESYIENSLSNPNHYIFSPRILIVGNLVLFIDAILLIVVFEYISKKTKFLFIQILFTMLLVVSIDTILFSTITFWELDHLGSILKSGLTAKNSFALFYSIIFYLYFRYLEETDRDLVHFNIYDVFKPLTYKQKFEAALTNVKKSEEMYGLITNNSYDIICLLDLNGTYKYVSPSIKTILGYNQSDFIGNDIFSIVHKDDLKQLKENIDNKSFKNENKNNACTIRLLHANGEYVWIEYTIAPIYENRKITSFVSSARDVTKRIIADQKFKKSSELLKIREHFLNESSKIAKIGFAEYNDEIKSFTWSDYLYTIFGVKQTDTLPTHEEFVNFFDNASKLKIKSGIEKLYTDGTPIKEELKVINTKDDEVWISVIINPIYNSNNKVIGRRAVVQNISNYKKAQLELEKSKQEIENSFNLLKEKDNSLKQTSKIAKIGYWEYNIKSERFILSSYVYTIYGLDPKNKIPSRNEMIEFYDKSSREKYKTATKNLEINGIPFDLELKIINAKKEEIWVRVVVQLVKDNKNNITGRQGIIQDITETKKARLALEKSNLEIKNSIKLIEQKERSLKETRKIAQLGYSEFIYETQSYIWTDYMYTIFGLNPKDKIPKRDELMALHDNESIKKLQEATIALETKGTPYDIELKLINFKKEEVWIRIVAHLIYNDQNKAIGRSGVFRDITLYKNNQLKLESYLKQLELKDIALKESNKIANIGYWEYHFDSNKTTCSNYVYEIYGLNFDEKIPDREKLMELYDIENQEKLKEATLKLMSNGKPYDLETKLINFKNEEIWTRNIVQPIFNSKNKIIGRRGLIQNITEYKKTQIALETSLELLGKKELSLKDSSKMAGIGYIEYDYATTKYTDYSEYIYSIFGLKPGEELTSKDEALAFFDEESQIKYLQSLSDVKKGKISDIELKGKNRKNEDIWIRSVSSPIFNNKKEVIKRRVVLQDIRNYKITQQELQKSLQLLKQKDLSLKDSSKIAGIGFAEYNYKKNVYSASKYIFNLFGVEYSEKISEKDLIHFFDQESQLKYKQALKNFKENGTTYDIELRGKNKKNEDIWLRSVASPIYNDKGDELIGRRIVLQDIKNFKKNQLELEQSKQEIQNSLDLIKHKDETLKESNKIANIGYWEYDFNNDTFVWSDYIYKIFGLNPQQKIPSRESLIDYYDEESKEKIKVATQNLITHGVPYDIELRLINANNEETWTRNVVHLVFNHKNEVIARRGLMQNITAYKKAQLEIKQSLKLLERSEYSKNETSKVAKIGYHEYYSTTKTFYWSEYMYNIFGVEPNQKIPKRSELTKLFYEDSRKKLTKATKELETYGLPYDLELKLFNFKNEETWIRMSNHPIYDSKKTRIIGRRGVAQDITQRKKIEEEHLKIKKDYIRLFNNATISIWNEDLTLLYREIIKLKKLNLNNITVYLEQNPELIFKLINKIKVNYVNKATLKLFKADNEHEFFNNINVFFGDGAEKVFIKLVEAIWKDTETFVSEVNYKTLEGDQFTAILSIPIPKTVKEQKTVPVSIQSIQSIKDAEFALKESLHKLKEAQKLGRLGNFEINPLTNEFSWSDEIYNIFGFDPKKGLPSYEDILNTIHPDDLEYHNQKIDEALNQGIPFDIEFRIITPQNEEKHIRVICELVKDSQGNVIFVKGINQDITEQKKIINEIEKTQEMYRLVTDHTNDLICLHDINGNLLYISPSITTLLGYSNIAYSRPFFDIIHTDELDKLKAHIKQSSLNSNFKKPIDFRAKHKDGHFIWFEALTSSAYRENENRIFVTIARDITESVLIEEEIKEYQESLQKLTTEITLVEENQKKEIATNIHDHLSQALVISNMKVKELKLRENLKEINEELSFIEEHISDALANSRKITSELSPPILYQFGIIEALYWLLDNIENKHKIKCKINESIESFKLDDVSSILLFRSIQEIINNTIKYAQASLITLDILHNKRGLNFVIKDNGKGFDVSKLNKLGNQNGSGFGLFTVKERIRNIRGKFKITSKIEKGTTVKIFIPLKNE